ncbi:MAG TPA: OmpA family protein [Gemmatimonadaceae bacterium]|nr:OmpA family protein [Gemmatimonadaceae bacterium]
MRRSVSTSLILMLSAGTAVTARAQSAPPASGQLRELGIFATGRILSTEYSVDDGRMAFGGAATFGTFLNKMFAVQGGLAVNYSRQQFTYYKPPLFTFTPTVSVLIGQHTGEFQPYALVGAGYEFVKYTHPRCDCAQTRSLGVANVGAGFRKMMGPSRALRAELSSQIGSGGPAFTVMAGMSFLIGGQPGPSIKPQMRPPTRVKPEPPVVILPRTTSTNSPPRTAAPPATPGRVIKTAPSPLPTGVGTTLLAIDGTQVDFTKPTWRDEIETLLDGLVIDLTSDAGMPVKISVEAHTDNIGSNAANIMLGLDRARAVREYLVTQGITADRIRISSAGEDTPVTTNNTALGRQQNRRIIIKRDN